MKRKLFPIFLVITATFVLASMGKVSMLESFNLLLPQTEAYVGGYIHLAITANPDRSNLISSMTNHESSGGKRG